MISLDQYSSILARLTQLELLANNLVTATNKLISIQQLQALTVQLTTNITNLQNEVAVLKTKVELLQQESFE